MSVYISREAAVKIAKKYGLMNGAVQGHHTGLADCIAIEIAWMPAADVEPVRHGRWVVDYPDGTIYEGAALRLMFALITCSECGKTFELAKIGKARYCTCGAKMDLEGETNDD